MPEVPPPVLLRDVEVEGARCDVLLRDGRVAGRGQLRPGQDEEVLDGEGGALLPGLHDHHVHLMALAASLASVDVRPGLAALAAAPGEGWLRGVGWAQDGDAADLDRVVPDRPVRVQHRSGALWVVNSRAIRELRLDEARHPGIERDAAGRPTGRLWRADAWLGRRIGLCPPDLAGVGRHLAALGVTGATDATPDLDRVTCTALRSAVPQRLLLLGNPDGDGPRKVVLEDSALPDLDVLVDVLRRVRPRPIAAHCVSRVALVLFLAALDEVGRVPGDRIEHAAVVPAELVGSLPAVVTQPGFIADRGDDYLRDVEPEDLRDLYRFASLRDAGVPVVPSSDAPYGPADPWRVLAAARDRTTPSGRVIGRGERVTVRTALDGMLRPLEDLTGPPRAVAVGASAELVLLSAPLSEALANPSAGLVRATWIAGALVAGSL